MIRGNPFVHVELNTTDLKKAETFYSHLFEWKLEPMPMGDDSYIMIKVGEGVGGGMMKHPVPGAPSSWLAYVQVSDIHAATSKAKSLGAKVMRDVTEVRIPVVVLESVAARFLARGRSTSRPHAVLNASRSQQPG